MEFYIILVILLFKYVALTNDWTINSKVLRTENSSHIFKCMIFFYSNSTSFFFSSIDLRTLDNLSFFNPYYHFCFDFYWLTLISMLTEQYLLLISLSTLTTTLFLSSLCRKTCWKGCVYLQFPIPFLSFSLKLTPIKL